MIYSADKAVIEGRLAKHCIYSFLGKHSNYKVFQNAT